MKLFKDQKVKGQGKRFKMPRDQTVSPHSPTSSLFPTWVDANTLSGEGEGDSEEN